jgi:hypothetical protein
LVDVAFVGLVYLSIDLIETTSSEKAEPTILEHLIELTYLDFDCVGKIIRLCLATGYLAAEAVWARPTNFIYRDTKSTTPLEMTPDECKPVQTCGCPRLTTASRYTSPLSIGDITVADM